MAEALPFISVGALIICVAVLIVAAFALRETRRAVELMEENVRFPRRGYRSLEPPGLLDEEHRWPKKESKREYQEHLGAYQWVGQLGKDQQETTPEWDRQRLLEKLEQLLQMSLESHQQAQTQEWQRLQPKQERQHLAEELERWRRRYLEAEQQVEQLTQERLKAQQQIERLEQEYSEAQRQVEQLKQEREQSYLARQELLEKLTELIEILGEKGFGRQGL